MFAAVPMSRVRIQVPGRDAAAVTHAIARLGLLHLIDIAHGRIDAAPAGTTDLLARHQALHARIRRTAERLGMTPAPLAGRVDESLIHDFAQELDALDAAFSEIERDVDARWAARADAAARAADAGRLLDRARRIERAELDVPRLLAARFAAVRVAIGAEPAFESLGALLAPTPFAIVPVHARAPDILAVVAVPGSSGDRLDAALRLVQIEPLSRTALEQSAAVEPLELTLAEARDAETAATGALADLARDRSSAVAALLARAEACVLLLQAQARFGATGRFVVISGWIPTQSVAAVRALVTSLSPLGVVDVETPEDSSASSASLRVPILHRNPVLLRPFQPLIDLYGVPQYREVQPTAFFALSFLLMFGLMFGDVGHGAMLVSAGYCLFRYVPRFLDYGILLMEAGAASTIFGVLYGSVFGVEGLLPVLWMAPLADLPSFMRVAVALGVVLVSTGLLLNVVNNWRSGERAGALLGTTGLFGAFLYWTTVALLARGFMPGTVVVPDWLLWTLGGCAVALIALRRPLLARLPRATRSSGPPPPVWLRALEGSVELVDTLFAYFANTVSFVRIAAFAALHAAIFIALFAVSDTLADMRFGRPFSIAALVIGNILLVLLEGLTVSVQVLRLEYYEFFGKFFRGGGEQYRPLMLRSDRKGGVP